MSVSETGPSADTVREWQTSAASMGRKGGAVAELLNKRIVRLAEEWERQAATITMFRRALEFYADHSMWVEAPGDTDDSGIVISYAELDHGERARRALAVLDTTERGDTTGGNAE